MSCVSDVLAKLSPNLEGTALLETCTRASELLRVLIYVAEPLRMDQHTEMPVLDEEVQNRFFDVIHTKLEWMASKALSYTGTQSEEMAIFVQPTVLLARFLQFDLGFRGIWTERVSARSASLVSALFRLVLVRYTIFAMKLFLILIP
jgi:mediator of RNA polymerase II transcription subunit 12, fungi type